ncbi:MAG: ATP-binding cassette domain-containing protein [Bacteroidetes bacterium]|nr:MAG: ATP-binding cassette domain-containing protein [Bacteroidota bacterium]
MARRGKDKGADMPKTKITKDSLQKGWQLFSFVGPYKWKFLLGLFFLAGTGATALAFPYLLGDLLRSATISMERINEVGLILLVVFVAQAVFSFFRIYLFVDVTERMLAAVRSAAYNRLISMPMEFFTQRRVGELASRISSDISQIQDTFTTNIAEFLRQLIIIIGGIAFLFFTSSKLALAMLLLIPVLAVLTVVFGYFVRKQSRKVQDHVAESNAIVEETLLGIQNVKAFANEFYEMGRYAGSVNQVRQLAVKVGKLRGAFASFIILGLFGGIVALIWYGVYLMNQGELDSANLVQFIMYTLFVGASIGGIAEQYNQIQKTLGASDRVLEILNGEAEELQDEEVKSSIHGAIEFKNLAFAYPGRKETPVLKNINFSAKEGQQIALVGPSGAGKSTIASLLLRFYEPDSGQILIDGKPSTEYGLTALRNQMAIVPQDVILFGGSIRENIQYGKPGASDEDIIEAAKQANAWEFISNFPEGLDTVVGDRGIKLSGGQRQRIAIARAILKDPAILLLDEATSSLDSESEKLVQEALERLMQGRTSLVIAHRLSTIRNSDTILVLQDGEIREQGTHDELFANPNGLYRKLSTMQLQSSSEIMNS